MASNECVRRATKIVSIHEYANIRGVVMVRYRMIVWNVNEWNACVAIVVVVVVHDKIMRFILSNQWSFIELDCP